MAAAAGPPQPVRMLGLRLAVLAARARFRLHLARLGAAREWERHLGPLPTLRQVGMLGALGVALCAIGWDAVSHTARSVSRRGPEEEAAVAAPLRVGVMLVSLPVVRDETGLETRPPAPPRQPALRSPEGLARDVARGDVRLRQVALTFDGGAEANAAPEILDVLRAREARVTVFLTGGFIRRHPDVVRRLVREGHEVGNHTDAHPHLTAYAATGRHETLPGVTREFVQRELARTAEAFARATGGRLAPYWRAPYGEHNAEIRSWAAEAGYRHVAWTHGVGEDLDTRDWVSDRGSHIYWSAEEIRDRILAFGRGRPEEANGGIILMHLGTTRQADRAHARLRDIVDGLRGRGYGLVTIGEMLGSDRQISARLDPRRTN